MPKFTTRVELHSATEADYKQLHAAMEVAGFSRTIKRENEPLMKLPTAEYNEVGDYTINEILERNT